MFRKLEFDKIYYEYLNESPFKYHISIFFRGGGPEFGKTCLYNTCMLPYPSYWTDIFIVYGSEPSVSNEFSFIYTIEQWPYPTPQ